MLASVQPLDAIFFYIYLSFFGCFCLFCVCVIIGKKKPEPLSYISCPLSIECLQFFRNGASQFVFLFQGERHRGGGGNQHFSIEYERHVSAFSTKTKKDASGNGFPLSFSTTLCTFCQVVPSLSCGI